MSEVQTRNYRRHARVYRVAKRLLMPFLKWLFKLEAEPVPHLEAPYLVYANHNTDLDAAFVQCSFDEVLYFVASEHIFRVKFASRLLTYLFDPISRLKGSTDMSTVREVMRRLRDGKSVCIFAEGNRSFNGLTGPIPPSVGKLVKACKVPLVTYRFEGGYFTTPRWAYTIRRGRMRGYVVNVYNMEKLTNMSVDDVNDAINRDLFEDAYARQAMEMIPFKGKRLAEGLETALFICPQCQQIGTLQSKNNEFYCSCGLKATYDEYGYLSGAPYSTVTEWDTWQSQQLAKVAEDLRDEPAFVDGNVKLNLIMGNHRGELVEEGSGTLAMYRDKMVCGTITFAVDDISDMALYGRGNIALTHQGKNYTITGGRAFCGRKYLELYHLLRTTR
jgi:1-acyl-sn-glycerol-3-phosphate acyltransferase